MKREPILDELQTTPLELRVLYGPQSGSRLTLSLGESKNRNAIATIIDAETKDAEMKPITRNNFM